MTDSIPYLNDSAFERRMEILDFIVTVQDSFSEFFRDFQRAVFIKHRITSGQAVAITEVLPVLTPALYAHAFTVAGAGMALTEGDVPKTWDEIGDLFIKVANGYREQLRNYIEEEANKND